MGCKDLQKSLLLIFTLFFFSGIYGAENTDVRPKVGLALSGGAALGLAHIGVLKVLEEADIPIDAISGTSMGAIVGGLYAIGYSAAELERLALETDWNDLFIDNPQRRYLSMEEKMFDERYISAMPFEKGSIRLPTGIMSGYKIVRLLSTKTWHVHHVTDFRTFEIPFSCVTTDLETGHAETLDHGFLPEAIRASMAIPSVFTPVEIEGRLLVDGGLVRNFPVPDVQALGADIIIGVDLWGPLKKAEKIDNFFEIIIQSVKFFQADSLASYRKKCTILIEPDLESFTVVSFARAAEIIKTGENAARKFLPQLKMLSDSLGRYHSNHIRTGLPVVDQIIIKEISIRGVDFDFHKSILTALNIQLPSAISKQDLESTIDRVYSLRLFHKVFYSVEPVGNGVRLILHVEKREQKMVHFGLRFDSMERAAMVLNTTLRNVIENGSNLHLELRLGERQVLDSQLFSRTGLVRGTSYRLRTCLIQRNVDIYARERRSANLRVQRAFLDALWGSFLSNKSLAGLGIRSEILRISPRIAPQDISTRTFNVHSFFAQLWIDTLDRIVFPSRGTVLKMESAFSLAQSDSSYGYALHSVELLHYHKMDALSIIFNVKAGYATRNDMPMCYQFTLGGYDSFWGMKNEERRGRYLGTMQLGVSLEFLKGRYFIVKGNIGNADNIWRWKGMVTGGGASLGTNTPVGPLEFCVMSSNIHRIHTYLNIGYHF
ncbi:patatin-like phospholipase family protein [candidate division KSB1 bacterium]|nr:patatin-like phospholipase family protein [candidate division KSB1 bacterium]